MIGGSLLVGLAGCANPIRIELPNIGFTPDISLKGLECCILQGLLTLCAVQDWCDDRSIDAAHLAGKSADVPFSRLWRPAAQTQPSPGLRVVALSVADDPAVPVDEDVWKELGFTAAEFKDDMAETKRACSDYHEITDYAIYVSQKNGEAAGIIRLNMRAQTPDFDSSIVHIRCEKASVLTPAEQASLLKELRETAERTRREKEQSPTTREAATPDSRN